MKRIIVCLTALFVAVSAYAQFDGAVGTEGCQAISLHDSRIQSWAFGVEVQRGYQQNSTTDFASYGQPYMAQGLPDSTTTTAVACFTILIERASKIKDKTPITINTIHAGDISNSSLFNQYYTIYY